MMITRKDGFFLLAAIAVVMFASCSGFFTHSLASGLARDQDKVVPKVTVDNIDDLITQSEGNPDMAEAVLEAIEDAMADASPAEQATLRTAAVKVASTSSGVGVAVLNDGGTILDTVNNSDLDDPAVKSDLISAVSDSLGGLSNLQSTSETLVAVLPAADDTAAMDAFAADSTADDLAMAAIVLLSAQAESSPGGSEDYMDNFDSSATDLTPEEELAVELAIRAKEKGGSGTIADLLNALNL